MAINVILNLIIKVVSFITTSLENHKTEYDFEDSFNLKFFSLSLCTHFTPLLLQGIYYPLVDQSKCFYIEKNMFRCDYDLTSYFIYYSMILTIWTILQNILSYYGVRANLAFFRIQARSIYKKIFSNNQFNLRNFAVRDNAYLNLNSKIISDKLKKSFNINQDMEMITIEYSEMIINYSIFICYGLVFPLSFLINYLIYCFFVSLDRNKLCFFYRRPLPKKANSIRKWYTMMQIVSLISIPINASLVLITNSHNIENKDPMSYAKTRMIHFLLLIAFQVVIKAIIYMKYGTRDHLFHLFVDRSKFLTETNIARLRFDKIANNFKKSIPIY